MESCHLVGRPDLNLRDTVQTYNLDGIRVDTVPQVPKDFWTEYSQSASVYSIGEVFSDKQCYVASYQKKKKKYC